MDREVVALHWLGGQVLLVLTDRLQLLAIDPIRSCVLESVDSVRPASLAYHSLFVNPQTKEAERCYAPAARCSDSSLLLTGLQAVLEVRVLGWADRVRALTEALDWEGGLALALDFYEGKAKGVVGLPRSKRGLKTALNDHLVEIALQFVDAQMKRLKEERTEAGLASAVLSPGGGSVGAAAAGGAVATASESASISAVAATALEFFCAIDRMDEVFRLLVPRFLRAPGGDVVLALLEPYLFAGAVSQPLDASTLQALASKMAAQDRLAALEQVLIRTPLGPAAVSAGLTISRRHRL